MLRSKYLNYKEEYIPPVYDDWGHIIEPAHILHYYRYRNYRNKKVSCSYKFIDEVVDASNMHSI